MGRMKNLQDTSLRQDQDRPAVRTLNLSKRYHIYERPSDRLKQFLFRGRKVCFREFHALSNVSFEVKKGEVLGIVGKNGSGKSTLLQLICGTLSPSSGTVEVNGRIAALLELGAGFNPEFTGRENVYLNASILGLDQHETESRYEEIVEFSGIREFMDQPVKTYSSGMYVRLAFSIATCVDPDILVIDEALSVGDGEFARKSFDRIMKLKESGKTILFCSHSMYQIEAICDHAIWLAHGKVMAQGDASEVVHLYHASLFPEAGRQATMGEDAPPAPHGLAKLGRIRVSVDGLEGGKLLAESGKSEVRIAVSFASDPSLPCPTLSAGFMLQDGRVLCSAWSLFDKIAIPRKANGSGEATLIFPELPLLKGDYRVAVYLFCEKGIHVYDCTNHAAEIRVRQEGLEQGIVMLPHAWFCAENQAAG